MSVSIVGRVVLVVGASSGIGRASAALLAREGAHVVAAARRKERLQSLEQELAKENRSLSIHRADATRSPDMESLARYTLDRFGSIDVLVYAAGTNIRERAMEQLTPGAWESLMNANLNGAFYATHAVLPAMRAAHSGQLIYLSSLGGLLPDMSGAAYQASKRGILGLAHAIRMEEKLNGIRTSVICPGLVNTELVEQRPVKVSPEVLAQALQPQDVAEAIVYITKLPPHAAIPELHMAPASQ